MAATPRTASGGGAEAKDMELVGFDACLMGNLETAKAMAPYAHVMVASEELEPGAGWNFTPMLQTLAKSPKMSGIERRRTHRDSWRQRRKTDKNSELNCGVIAVIRSASDREERYEKICVVVTRSG